MLLAVRAELGAGPGGSDSFFAGRDVHRDAM